MTPAEKAIARCLELDGKAIAKPWPSISNNRDIDETVVWSSGPEDNLKHPPVTYKECSDDDLILIAEYRSLAPQLAKALRVALEAIEKVKCFSTSDETLLWEASNRINAIFAEGEK